MKKRKKAEEEKRKMDAMPKEQRCVWRCG